MTVTAIIVAAGQGTRMNLSTRKQYLPVSGRPILQQTVSVFEGCPAVDNLVLVVPEPDLDYCHKQILKPINCQKQVTVVSGGASRQNSVYNGLKALNYQDSDIVVIHDGVRPFVSCQQITDCVTQAGITGAAVLAVQVLDTLKKVDTDGIIRNTLEREAIWKAQTPQAFQYHLIRSAHEKAIESKHTATDDALLVERLGVPVHIVPGSTTNMKITTPEDLALAEAVIHTRNL